MKKSLTILLSSLLLAGPATILHAQAQTDSHVQFQNKDARGITVSNVSSAPNNGALGAQAQLNNTSGSTRHVYYRFRWLDGQGQQIGPNSDWKPILLTAGRNQTVKDRAPSANASNFRLEINVD